MSSKKNSRGDANNSTYGMFYTGNKYDYRGDLFTALCLKPSNYRQREIPTPINGIETIMCAGNYTNSSELTTMMDYHVHHEFTDFVIQSALWHKQLDQIIETPGSVPALIKAHANELERVLLYGGPNATLNGTMPSYGFNYMYTRPVEIAGNVGAFSVSTYKALTPLNLYNDGVRRDYQRLLIDPDVPDELFFPASFKFLALDSMLALHVLNINTPLSASPLERRNALVARYYIDHGVGYFDNVVNQMTNHIMNGHAMRKLYISDDITHTPFSTNFINFESPISFDSIMSTNGVSNEKREIVRNDIRKIIKNFIVDTFLMNVVNIHFSKTPDVASVFNTLDNADPALNEPAMAALRGQLIALMNSVDGNEFARELFTKIKNTVVHSVRNAMELRNPTIHELAEAKVFYEYVTSEQYRNEQKTQQGIERDAMMRSFISIRERDSSHELPYNAGPPRDEKKDFIRKARFNFKKEGAYITHFASVLPSLPMNEQNIKRAYIWYTKNGVRTLVDIPYDRGEFFSILYEKIYMAPNNANGISVDVNGARFDVPGKYVATGKSIIFNLNKSSHILSRLMRNVVEMKRTMDVNEENDVPVLWRNVSSGVTWKRENGLLYRYHGMGPGELVNPSDNKGQINPLWEQVVDAKVNCASTFANSEGDISRCSRFVEKCLGNFGENGINGISQCMADRSITQDFLTLTDEYKGIEGIKKLYREMNPFVAKQILDKFGFEAVPQGNELNVHYVVESYSDWIERNNVAINISTDEVQNLVRSSSFQNYVSALVNFLNSDKKILNRDYQDAQRVDQTLTAFEIAAGLKRSPIIARGRLNVPMGLSSSISSSFLPPGFGGNNVFTSNPMTLQFMPNVNMAGGGKHRRAFSGGGNFPPNVRMDSDIDRYSAGDRHGAKLLKRIFANIVAELKVRNKVLGEDTERKIANQIENLEIMESEVVDGLTQLDKYASLASIINTNSSNTMEMTDVRNTVTKNMELIERYKKGQFRLFGVLTKIIRITNDDPIIKKYEQAIGSTIIPNRNPNADKVMIREGNKSLMDL